MSSFTNTDKIISARVDKGLRQIDFAKRMNEAVVEVSELVTKTGSLPDISDIASLYSLAQDAAKEIFQAFPHFTIRSVMDFKTNEEQLKLRHPDGMFDFNLRGILADYKISAKSGLVFGPLLDYIIFLYRALQEAAAKKPTTGGGHQQKKPSSLYF